MKRAFALPAVLAALALLAGHGEAAASSSRVDDSDLSGPPARRQPSIPAELRPDQVQALPSASGPLILRLLRRDHGQPTPVTDLELTTGSGDQARGAITGSDGTAVLEPGCTGETRIEARLRNEHFSVIRPDGPYRLTLVAPCSGEVTVGFEESSDAGQALGIWQVAARARSKLRQEVGLAFWRSSLDFVWPADGDYYAWGRVHVSRGDHWDIVGHEMGHGVYDLAAIGRSRGGAHKIDECHSETLALSEGWASFFSAWISVDLADPDARFEHLVPRRAPIRFETIPQDVCLGETNEWRVTGFFWDLIDSHVDGESSLSPFARVWAALAGSRAVSTSEGKALLARSGFDPSLLGILWELNFHGKSATVR